MAEYFAHESCYIDEGCTIGAGTKIWHFSHVMTGACIGRGCNIGQNVVVSPDVIVGDNVKIQNNVSLYTGVILEDDVFCGPSIVFTNVINPRSHVPRKSEYQRTLVKRGASLGANSTILCGHTIGCYAFVGAGSVVTRDVPDYALVVVAKPTGKKAYVSVSFPGILGVLSAQNDSVALSVMVVSDPKTRQKYFGYYSSGSAKSTTEALAAWQAYWCGLTTMTESAFTGCYCTAPKP